MLRFNSFRSERYLRSKFKEGAYLLASENTDLELETLDITRKIMRETIGDIAIDNSWKVERYSIACKITSLIGLVIQTDYTLTTELIDQFSSVYKNGVYVGYISIVAAPNLTLNTVAGLSNGDNITIVTMRSIIIKPGEAWFNGLPFYLRNGKDANISLGTVKSTGVNSYATMYDDPSGQGKVVKFLNSTNTNILDSGLYRIVVTAREEVVTNFDDPFLKNANISESTAQKIKLVYKVNIVPENLQTETPAPYTGDDTTDANLVNQVKITPSAGANGEQISLNVVSGSEEIDGRNLELVVRNDSGIGAQVIPFGTADQQAFFNGKLIDCLGNTFHINAIYNDTVPGQTIIRLDAEAGQPDPRIINGSTYILQKKDVFYGDDSSGIPNGNLFWPIAKVNWNSSSGIKHHNYIADMRGRICSQSEFQDQVNVKFDLKLTQGGTIDFGDTLANAVTWSADLTLVNPHGPSQTISANSVIMVDGGSIIYDMDIINGGIISKGNLSYSAYTHSGGTLLTFTGTIPDLEQVEVGNVIKNSSGEIAYIVDVNKQANQVTINTAWVNNGSAVIYLDSYGPSVAPKNKDIFVLAVRKSSVVYLGPIALQVGEQNSLVTSISADILSYIGSPNELDVTPDYTGYTGPFFVTNGNDLTNAIAELDKALNDIITAPIYDERTLFPSGLVAGTNITIPLNSRNGNIQENYVASAGILEIYVNQLFKFQSIDWTPISATQISFTFDLPNDAEVHFRKATLGGGSSGGGGGGGTLQDAYDAGKTITTILGFPMTIDGPSGTIVWIKKDLQVDGLVI